MGISDHIIMKGVAHPWVPLTTRSYRVVPQNDIIKLVDSKFHWEATGDDPFFTFAMKKRAKPGWFRIEAQILSGENSKAAESKLYIDYGEGFSEYNSISLPKNVGDTSFSIIFRFNREPKALRLDPLDMPGKFTIKSFLLTSLPETLACYSMMRSISGMGHPSAHIVGKNIARLRKKGPRGMMENLYKDYRKICLSKSTDNVNYQTWISKHDVISDLFLDGLSQSLGKSRSNPLISILMPVYNSSEKFLQEAIKSVQKQAYKNWELCISDDASTLPHVREILRKYEGQDSRIKVVFRDVNGHISAASNSALRLASGEWITFMDHDDILRPHALAMMVFEINKDSQVKLIYSDEDKINEKGERYDPHFKPDWNPDLFLSINYLNHLTAIKAEIVKKIGGFRIGFEGSQDYDLLLHALELINPEQICHIPHILYHWRATTGSTALNIAEKGYTSNSGQKALSDYICRKKLPAIVKSGPFPTSYRVTYLAQENHTKVSLIIPTRNGGAMLKRCIDSIQEKTNYHNFEIVVVDNQSDEQETLSYLSKLRLEGNIRLLKYNHEFNYSAINNYAVSQCTSEIIGLINDDIEVIEPDWLTEMVSHAQRENVGAVGAKLLYADGRVQHAGVITGIGGVAGHAHKYQPCDTSGYFGRAVLAQSVSAVTAACLIVQRKLYNHCGGLNSSNLKIAFNDVDFCLRLQQNGYRNIWTPYALLYHHESASRGTEDTPEKQSRFLSEVIYMQQTWGTQLKKDPAYNPNLTLNSEDYTLADPPRINRCINTLISPNLKQIL